MRVLPGCTSHCCFEHRLIVGTTRVASKTMGLNIREWLQPRKLFSYGSCCTMICYKCRPVYMSGKAVALCGLMDTRNTETAEVGVQAHGDRSAEITSGRANFQQGFATTCIDFSTKGNRRREENLGLAHESVGAMKAW